ncbi:MAG: hypothetical protein ACREJC_10920 [Tepidisphaeraceae bacterium]
MSKSIFQSKTFWVNVLTGAATIAGGSFGVPTHIAVPIVTGVNILLRFITKGPVSILGT